MKQVKPCQIFLEKFAAFVRALMLAIIKIPQTAGTADDCSCWDLTRWP
jgi:hypothetical protein